MAILGQLLTNAFKGQGSRKFWSKSIESNLVFTEWFACVHAQSGPTLCDPLDCSPGGSSGHEILQARILEWVAISFARGSVLSPFPHPTLSRIRPPMGERRGGASKPQVTGERSIPGGRSCLLAFLKYKWDAHLSLPPPPPTKRSEGNPLEGSALRRVPCTYRVRLPWGRKASWRPPGGPLPIFHTFLTHLLGGSSCLATGWVGGLPSLRVLCCAKSLGHVQLFATHGLQSARLL